MRNTTLEKTRIAEASPANRRVEFVRSTPPGNIRSKYSRVLSTIGSFTSIQWHPGQIDGGNVYPNKVRKEPNRNIRVYLKDGSEDLENNHGSWPLQNIQLANSLKMMEYDFHLQFGNGSHNGADANSQL